MLTRGMLTRGMLTRGMLTRGMLTRGMLTLNTTPRARGAVQRLAEPDRGIAVPAPSSRMPFGDMIDYLASIVGIPNNFDPNVMVFAAANKQKYTISKAHFAEIPDTAEPKRIAFVDGGSTLLEEGPAFLIGMNRVYYSMFKGNERQRPTLRPRTEFFSCLSTHSAAIPVDSGRSSTPSAASRATTNTSPTTKSLYSVKLFTHTPGDRGRLPSDDDLEITDEDIKKQGTSRTSLLGMPRKMAEWAVADSVVANELTAGDVLVMDGTLQSGSRREHAFATRVYKRAIQKGVVVCGLAKTTTLTTVDNRPLVHCASEVARTIGFDDKRWFVKIGERATADDKGYTFIVRLHEKSAYAFRLGILAEQYRSMSKNEVESVLASVAANSRDIAMLGYPYGAIDADRFAKVRMREATMYKNMLDSVLMGRPDGADLAAQIRSMTTHQMLNRVTG